MYAVIRAGGHQYRATVNGVLRLEKMEAQVGDEIRLGEVLLLNTGEAVEVGTPLVDGAYVTATVLKQGRGRKIAGFTYKAKKNVRRRFGHRQAFTEVRVSGIHPTGGEAPPKPEQRRAPEAVGTGVRAGETPAVPGEEAAAPAPPEAKAAPAKPKPKAKAKAAPAKPKPKPKAKAAPVEKKPKPKAKAAPAKPKAKAAPAAAKPKAKPKPKASAEKKPKAEAAPAEEKPKPRKPRAKKQPAAEKKETSEE